MRLWEPSQPAAPASNYLLARLAPSLLAVLNAHLLPVDLARRQILFRAGEPLMTVYFPDSAIVSLVARLESGETLDVGFVGREGVAGTAIFPGVTRMPCDGIVRVAGRARQIRAARLREAVIGDASLWSAMQRVEHLLLVRSMQMSVCNVFHSAEQRCIRSLLVFDDLVRPGPIPLTHESLASVLGVRRPTLTRVLQSLARAGLVREQRGRVSIVDRHALESECCECYDVMRVAQHRLMGEPVSYGRF
jgi:CRP-like cAMP-binding protein